MELVHIGAGARSQCEMMQSDAIAVELGAAMRRRRRPNRDRQMRVAPAHVGIARRRLELPKSEGAEHLVVKGGRARDIIDGQIEMFDAEYIDGHCRILLALLTPRSRGTLLRQVSKV